MLASVNLTDAVILSTLVAVVTLIIRGMLRGSIRTCDSASCSGSCNICHERCPGPHLRLSAEQLDELDELTRQAKEA